MKCVRKVSLKLILEISILLILSMYLSGCTRKIYIPVEHKSIETIMVRDTLVRIQLETIRDSVISPDTVSFLENKYARSWAKYSKGNLSHSLQTKTDSFPIKIHYIEKEIKTEIPVPYPVETIKKVEKELTLWQKLKLLAGETLLIFIIVLLVIYKIKK